MLMLEFKRKTNETSKVIFAENHSSRNMMIYANMSELYSSGYTITVSTASIVFNDVLLSQNTIINFSTSGISSRIGLNI